MDKLPISAFIVTKNEGEMLQKCIESIQFCNEIIVVDLQSSDDSKRIAENLGASVHTVEPLPVVEMIHQKYIHLTKNDWVLITDPDEVTSSQLAQSIISDFEEIKKSNKIGSVEVPIVYFFKKHRLRGTSWGGIKWRTYLIHKERNVFFSSVHKGRLLKDNFQNYTLKYENNKCINHYWMQSYRQIFEKHIRYLKNEGKARFVSGRRTTIKKIVKIPYQQFRHSYIYTKGYKDGFIGIFLSLFRAWYFTIADIELYKYQKQQFKKV